MFSKAFLNFLSLSLYRHRVKHAAIFVMAVIIVALFSAVMFLSGAIRNDIGLTLDGQADFTVQRMRGGKVVDSPLTWIDEFAEIPGVTAAIPRVFGRYYFEPNRYYFTVVGVDPFDTQATTALEKLVDGLDARDFLGRSSMIIGNGVRRFLTEHHYLNDYTFTAPDRSLHQVFIHDILPPDSDLVGSDTIIMEIGLARRVLGVGQERCTDIALQVPNELEGDSVMFKLIQKHFDIRVIQKKEIATAYRNLFNYRGGVFLLLYLIVLVTYVLIIYQRYSLITGPDRREIGILRAVGWSIGDVITLKVAENLVVALGAFLLGVILAYLYVFPLRAPLLSAVFFGFGNLPVDFQLTRCLDPVLLGTLFLFFIAPFTAAVLIPVWRVAITDPREAMK
jgi:ABC-type lipoprotein release transport system permease subunit